VRITSKANVVSENIHFNKVLELKSPSNQESSSLTSTQTGNSDKTSATELVPGRRGS
jgi:hypothetical protein